jgi:hypothetical protein
VTSPVSLTWILEVPYSILGRDRGYPEWSISRFYSAHLDRIGGGGVSGPILGPEVDSCVIKSLQSNSGIANSIEQSPSWETDKHSASLDNHLVSLPYSQKPATGSYPEPDASSPQLPTLFTRDLI